MTLSAWRTRHGDFAAALRALRRIAPERDPERFAAVLDPLDAMLRTHMAQEETVLLPAAEGLPLPINGTPRVLRRDHDRLRELIGRIRAEDDPLGRAEDLLRLGEVLDHHDRREALGLLPVLDAHVPASTRTEWLARFRAEESALAQVPAISPRPVPPPVRADLPPLDGLRLAAAQDGPLDVRGIGVPDHPKGPKLHARLLRAVEAARAADLPERRDRLVEVLAAARLLRLLS